MYIFERKSIDLGGEKWAAKFKIKEFIEFIRPKITLFKELISLMRPETCLFISGMAVSGYLLFNNLDIVLVFLFSTAFFTSATAYSLNYLTDKEEDQINNARLNAFVVGTKGTYAVISFFSLSFFSALFLSGLSFILYLICVTMGIVYSAFRVKEIFLFKHIYMALTIALTFLIGAAVGGQLEAGMLAYLPFVFLFSILINLLGDLRGYEGDKSIGMKTIPIVFGRNTAKNAIHFILGLVLVSIIVIGHIPLYPLLPFTLLISFFLKRDDWKNTRRCILFSFISLPFALVVM